jgi:hypothetical protein
VVAPVSFASFAAFAKRLAAAGAACVVAGVCATACKPNLDQTVSLVSEPIVLAVRPDPAEAPPSATMHFTALYVGPNGAMNAAPIQWDLCEARKPLADLGPVNPQCLATSGSQFLPIGDGDQVSATIPADACMLFGPAVPPTMDGQPSGRPVDPDPTGGYYAPIRMLAADGTVTLEEARLSCGVGGASPTIAVDFGHRYHLNTNPAVGALATVAADGTAGAPLVTADATSGATTNPVKAGTHVTLRASWATCPTTDVCGDGFCGPDESMTDCAADCTTPVGCAGAERYVAFDIGSQSLVDQRESIAVAWYATAGTFDQDRTGRDSSDTTTTSDNGWQPPATPGPVHLWVVLRDDRGGVGWTEYVLDVQ